MRITDQFVRVGLIRLSACICSYRRPPRIPLRFRKRTIPPFYMAAHFHFSLLLYIPTKPVTLLLRFLLLQAISVDGSSCVGHRGSDVFPFGFGADSGSPTFKTRSGFKDDTDTENRLSNRQILQMLDPRVNGLNYIYDNFEWPQ